MDIISMTHTSIEKDGRLLSIKGNITTTDSTGKPAELFYHYIANAQSSNVGITMSTGEDIVPNDEFDGYTEETFGYVPADYEPGTGKFVPVLDLLFLEADWLAFERAVKERIDNALAVAEEAAEAFHKALTGGIAA